MSVLDDILLVTDPDGWQAAWRPVAPEPGDLPGCTLPGPVVPRLRLPAVPVVPDELPCELNFIPVPIVVPPFVPPFDTPCPDGFTFDAQFKSSAGQTMTQGAAGADLRPVALNFAPSAAHIDATTHQVLPEMQAFRPVEFHAQFGYTITPGVLYRVTLSNYNPGAVGSWSFANGILYNGRVYGHGQVFRGVPGVGAAGRSGAGQNGSNTFLDQVSRARMVGYDENGAASRAFIPANQTLGDGPINSFQWQRLVVGADNVKPTGGQLEFVNDPSGCGGRLIGEINLNPGDFDLPCAEGFQFDAGYVPQAGETATVATGGMSATIPGTVEVPQGTSPISGFPFPLPFLRVFDAVTETWVSARVTSQSTAGGLRTLNLATALPAGSFTGAGGWYLQRIMVSTGTTGGSMEFKPRGQCGGILLGEMQLDPAEVQTPCSGALEGGTLVDGDAEADRSLSYINHLARGTDNAAAAQNWSVNMRHDKIPGGTENNLCSYRLGLGTGAPSITIPDIRLIFTVNSTSTVEAEREYRVSDPGNDGRPTVVYTAAITTTSNPGGGGGVGGSGCTSCNRWS